MRKTRWVALAAAAAALCLGLAPDAKADGHEVKVGVILGFTGPIESLTPPMADSAELALKEASDSGAFLGGKGIIQTAVDTGAFGNFAVADGMIGDTLIEAIGDALNGTIATLPGSATENAAMFIEHAAANGVDGDGPFRGKSYDAAALIVLAMQAAGSADRSAIQAQVMAVANGPGEKILPGELAKALQILADGGEVDYEGATGVELNEVGEVPGTYQEMEVEGGAFVTKALH